MQTRVRYVLRDSEAAFVSDAAITTWLNEAYLDLVARLRLNKAEVTGTTAAGGTVSVPTGYIETISFSVLVSGDSTQTMVRFVDDDVFDSWRLVGDTPDAIFARIFNGTLETYPTQASVSYTWRYVKKPTALTSASDEPTLPEELHIRLINYARAHAKFQEGELDEGDRYMAMYETGLPGPPLAGHREMPGPINLVPELNWYDG